MSFPLRFLNNDTRGLATRFLIYVASAHSVLASLVTVWRFSSAALPINCQIVSPPPSAISYCLLIVYLDYEYFLKKRDLSQLHNTAY